jgi:hypothetical protein
VANNDAPEPAGATGHDDHRAPPVNVRTAWFTSALPWSTGSR